MSEQSVRRSHWQPVHESHHSSRSAYPSFLSVSETISLQLQSSSKGISDAFRWKVVGLTIAGDSEIRSNISKSIILNAISLFSIYAFDFFFRPLVQDQQRWLRRNVGWFYRITWLIPLIGLSFYLNVSMQNSWCSIIAQRTYTLQHGTRSVAPQPITYAGILKALATSAYRVVMIATSIVLSFALRDVPYAGPVVSFLFSCWLYAYYCFEYMWILQGWSLSRRVRYLEERWAYFFAFGFPYAAICTFGSSLASAALFALLFPVYIIMAIHARPVPMDPYSPSPSPNTGNIVCHPSPFVPIRLPIFAVVIWLNDWIVWGLSLGGGSHSRRHRRYGSVASDTAESIEMGEIVEPILTRASWRGPQSRRRKVD